MFISKIKQKGQSVWTDFLSRHYLTSGELENHIRLGVTGVTSNPSILKQAIVDGNGYDDDIRNLSCGSNDSIDVYEEIVRRDISVAADLLSSVYKNSNEEDGYVSIEVDPAFANRTDATICQGSHLNDMINRPNVMIKIPGTDAGILAFRQLIFEGVNVNVTLLFSVRQYEKVANAYVAALQDRMKYGKSLDVASVASFFVSRIDSVFDPLIPDDHPAKGKVATANASLAYNKWYEIFHSPAFVKLRQAGARPQRLLWASTSSKNPAYDPLKYVKSLLVNNSITTLPLPTLNLILKEVYQGDRDASHLYGLYWQSTYPADVVISSLELLGIQFEETLNKLLVDGVRLFADSFDDLMNSLCLRVQENKRGQTPQPRHGLV